MPLNNKFHLCYINARDLFQWIEENNFLNQDFAAEKEKWAKATSKEPNFFSDAELLLISQDILLLKVPTDSQFSFLAKTYQLEYQSICQKIFQEQKNIILVSARQWKLKEQKKDEKLVILFKDRESIEKSLASWLQGISD